ncbi:hypothetical protein N9545_02500 [Salibacteraceae bacterium]|nr:hypothetical protein [Salibacteraceae bacterium]MDB9710294.1 hypothetical protein [Salibacteraceae bacterium]
MKKTIAKHTLGLIGVGILWFILNQMIDDWIGFHAEGGWLLLGILVAYVIIYWAVKTIWFTKDKD